MPHKSSKDCLMKTKLIINEWELFKGGMEYGLRVKIDIKT